MNLSCLHVTPTVERVKAEIQRLHPELTDADIMVYLRGAADKYHKDEPTLQDVQKYLSSKSDNSLEDSSTRKATIKEMQAIKEKAIADGTFMLAPNGKPTNLTEQQWLQVRTRAFKDWFGDWENNPANASKVVDENGEPLVVYTGVPVKGITEFSLNTPNRASLTSVLKKGIYFSDKNTASLYTKGKPVYKINQYVNEEQAKKINEWYYGEGGFDESGAAYVGLPLNIINSYIDEFTSEYTGELDNVTTPRGEVISAFLNIKNPVVADARNKTINRLEKSTIDSINNSEGAIVYHVDEHTKDDLTITDSTDYIVFDTNQIKSAESNNGDFSKSQSIYEDIDSQQHSFKFADGTVVSAPFTPNEQQADALNQMDEFVKSDETVMTLSGYAGTGKTSLMEILAAKFRGTYRPIVFTASTNKAAGVLKERVKKLGYETQTLHKAFGIAVKEDENQKEYDARNTRSEQISATKVSSYSIVVIDEASMLDEKNFEIIKKEAEQKHLKIIFLGDEAQLAPVGEDKISIVFRNPEGRIVRLTKVERTGDNAILKEATALRNGEVLSGESSFNDRGQGVAFMSPNNWNKIEPIIQRFAPQLLTDPNFFRVLAYTNETVGRYNDAIRRALGRTSTIPVAGEPIVGYQNWGYIGGGKGNAQYRFINSESYLVKSTGAPTKVSHTLLDGRVVSLEVIPITIENSMGNTDTINFVDVKGNFANRAASAVLAQEYSRLWKIQGQESFRERQAIEQLMFINDNVYNEAITLEDGSHPLIRHKYWDFGYAMTIHKSQGSTFTHVIVDDADITRGTQRDGVADKKQQLEYVGVSRATDTVTVLTYNVKKEDTPLNHVAGARLQERLPGGLTAEQIAGINAESKKLTDIIKGALKTTERETINNTDIVPQNLTTVPVGATLYASKVLQMIVDNPAATRQEKALATALIPLFNKTNLIVNFTDKLGDVAGRVRQEGTKIHFIQLNLASAKFKALPNKVTLHELTHALSISRLAVDPEFDKEINRLMDIVKDFLSKASTPKDGTYNINGREYKIPFDIYGLFNSREFFAEAMANPTFQELLANIPMPKQTQENVFTRIVKAIVDTFHRLFHTRYNANTSVFSALMPMIADTVAVTADANLVTSGFTAEAWNAQRTPEQIELAAKVMQALENAYADATVSQYATVAPYFRMRLNSTNKEDLEKATQEVKEKAQKLANLIGLTIKDVNTLIGTYQGKSEISYFYNFDTTDNAKIDLFASLMGDLSFEYQDAVIAATYISKEDFEQLPDENKAYEVVLAAPQGIAAETIEANLKELKIEGSSYNSKTGELTVTITAMDWDKNRLKTVEEIKEERDNIKQLVNYGYVYKETNRQNSRYLENRLRQSIYRNWMGQLGQQNRQLYNCCSKALAICEAAAHYYTKQRGVDPDAEVDAEETQRIKAAKEAAENWKPDNKGLTQQPLQKQQFYSGAADGSDKAWALAARDLGFDVREYTTKDWDALPQEQKNKYGSEYREIVKILGRRELPADIYKGKPVRRDMMQADKADAVFAIGTIGSNGYADGGTAYATTRGIQRGIPVYLYDRKEKQWKTWDYSQKAFVATEEPTITPNAALIGTRGDVVGKGANGRDIHDITAEEKQVIRDILQKSASSLRGNQPQVQQQAPVQQPQAPVPTVIRQEVPEEVTLSKVNLPNVSRPQYDEEVIRILGSTEKKRARVSLIVSMFSDAVDMLIAEETENGHPVTDRKTWIIEHLQDILGYTVDGEFVPGALTSIFDTRSEDTDDTTWEEFCKFNVSHNPAVWAALIEEASPYIQDIEGVVIQTRNVADPYEENEEEWEASGENIVSLRDGWMMRAREVDLRDNLSDKVRRLLARIPLIVRRDADGEPIYETDDLGFERYLTPDYAHVKLLTELANATDADSFDETLEKLAESTPWVEFVIEKLNEDPALRAAFYGDLRKEFVSYWTHVKNSSGNIQTKEVNKEPSIQYLFNSWQHQYDSHVLLSPISVYDKEGNRNEKNIPKVEELIKKINGELPADRSSEDFDYSEDSALVDMLQQLFRAIGVDLTKSQINLSIETTTKNKNTQVSDLIGNVVAIVKGLKENELKPGGPFIAGNYKSAYTELAETLNIIPEGVTLNSFRERGKSYQSFANPSWLGRFITTMHTDRADAYIEKQYGKFRLFRVNGNWRGDWIEKLTGKDKDKYRKLLARIVILHSDGKEYDKWSSKDYFDIMYNQFLATNDKNSAYYYLPILSDAPSAEFIKFVRYSGNNYKSDILNGLFTVFKQELERMWLVEEREKQGAEPVQNLDSDASKKFLYFPGLNTADKNGLMKGQEGYEDGTSFIEEYKRLLVEDRAIREQGGTSAKATMLARTAIANEMERGFQNFLDEVEGYGYSRDNKVLENYYWNNALAYCNIVQLTTADLAYYGGITDFQKRYKQVYSMTQRLYTNATWNGKLVGKRDANGVYENVVTLKDIIAPSRVLDEIKAVIANQVQAGHITQMEGDYIISQFTRVNATDAQAWRSLDSFRDIMIMAGKWTDKMQEAFDHLDSNKPGEWTVEDFNTMWLTIKPFLFSLSDTDSEVRLPDGTPYGKIPCPKQFKNSEMLLLALYGKIAMKEKDSPMLRAMNRVMKGEAFKGTESEGETVDAIQFESTEKVGGQAAINLNGYIKGGVIHLLNKEGKVEETIAWGGKHKQGKYVTVNEEVIEGAEAIIDNEEAIMHIMRTKLTKRDKETGKSYMYDKAVKKVYMEDYGIQVTSPEHLLDHEGIIQSQFKKHIAANLPSDFSCSVSGKTYTGEEVYRTIQEILTENILEGYKECEELFGSKEAVERELQKQMAGNKRYTAEDKKACTLVTKADGTKDWAMPLFDPAQAQRIQSLLLSVVKKKVVNPKMKRAYLVQATGVGFSKDLQIRYYDVNGEFLFNEKEFNGTEEARPKYRQLLHQMKKQYKTYAAYAAAHPKDANAVAYHEIAMPLPSKAWMNWCYDPETGTFDISKLDDDLREAVGLRSPNEAKYSSQPVYIKYLLPSNNGSIIMYPDEITTIVGADFDYDKIMLYLHEAYIQSPLKQAYFELPKKYRDTLESSDSSVDDLIKDLFGETFESDNSDLEEKQKSGFALWCKYMKETYPEQYEALKAEPGKPIKLKYDATKPVSQLRRSQRNNMFLDLAFAVLTNPTVSAQMHSPGNFDILKREKQVKAVLKTLTFDELVDALNIKKKEGEESDAFRERVFVTLNNTKKGVLDKILERYQAPLDPKSVQTQLYFHRQNSNASNMIGIYAVAGGSHSLLQHTKTRLKQPLEIFGQKVTEIDPMQIPFGAERGRLLSKNIEQFLAASVDDVKDPTLAALMQNPNTANITNGLIRMGFPISVATSMVVAQSYPYIDDSNTINETITEPELMELIQLQSHDGLTSAQHILKMQGQLKPEDAGKDTYDARTRKRMNDLMIKHANTLAIVTPVCDDIQNLTLMLRSDAPNNAAGPTVGHVLARFIKLVSSARRYMIGSLTSDAIDLTNILGPSTFIWEDTENGGKRLTIDWDAAVDFVYTQDTDPSKLRENATDAAVPFIQAATTTGVLGPMRLLREYFPQMSPNFVKMLVNPDYGLTSMINFDRVNMDEVASMLNKIVNEYLIYSLSSTPFFGSNPVEGNAQLGQDTHYNTAYYMFAFPDQVLDYITAHPELKSKNLLLSGLEFPIKNGVRMIEFQDSKDLSNTQEAQVTDSWAELALSDDPEVRNLAIMLFKYGSFMGLRYSGPHSFIHLAPAMLKASVQDYNAGLNLSLHIPSTAVGENFISQFTRNNYKTMGLKKITPKSLNDYKPEDTEITVSAVDTIEINAATSIQDGKLINEPVFANKIVLARKTDDGWINELFLHERPVMGKDNAVVGVVYKKLDTLGINGFKEYYAGEDYPKSVLDTYGRKKYQDITPAESSSAYREDSEPGDPDGGVEIPSELDKVDDYLSAIPEQKEAETPMVPAEEKDPATGEEICEGGSDRVPPAGLDDLLSKF